MPTENNAPASTTSAAPAELSMAEYAKQMEASMSGKPVQAAPAVATTAEPAATTDDDDVDQAAEAAGNEGVEGEPAPAPAAEDDPEKQIEDAHPAKKGIQKRFSEMTAKQKELQAAADKATAEAQAANARAEQAEADAQRFRAEAQAAQAAVPSVVDAADDPAPYRGDFTDPEDYTVALSAHTARKEMRIAAHAAKSAADERAATAQAEVDKANNEKMQAAIVELHSKFNSRVAEIKPDYPDYDEKVTNNTALTMRNDIFFMVEKAKDGPHVLYHLASNPDDLAEINKMHPQDAAIRIGELQAELRVGRKPKVTKAAAPVKPVGNRASPQRKSPNEETMDEYASRVEKEMAASAHKRSRII